MTSITGLIQDLANVLRACPMVTEAADTVEPYLDLQTSEKNAFVRMVYVMPSGTVLISWQSSTIAQDEMEGWAHQIDIHVRARRKESPLTLINAIIDGVQEGQSMRWRYLCVNEDVLPVQVQAIERMIDEEGIDLHVIHTLFKEKGDYPYGLPG